MAKKKKELPMMIVKSAAKDYLKSQGMMSSGDLIDKVNEKVAGILDDAAARTKSNSRSTVREGDV